MCDLETQQIYHSAAAVDCDVRGEREPKEDVDEDWEPKATGKPGEVSGVWEEVTLLVLLVDSWKERID